MKHQPNRKYRVQQSTERRVSAVLRITMAVALMLLNILLIVLLTMFLRENEFIVFIVLEIAAAVAAINIQSSQKPGSYKLAWTMLVVAFPVGGLILYLLWGGNLQGKQLDLLRLPPPECSGDEERRSEANLKQLAGAMPNWRRASELLKRRGFLLYGGTASTYFPTGAAYFEDAMERMAAAERFIFIEYFILAEGRLWSQFEKILLERAARGVEIKIIFDDFGNIFRMQGGTIERLKRAGIEIHIFNPVHRYVNRLFFNYRDHRKILVVDGQYAYTGGVNVADEYVGYTVRHGEWKDGGVLLDGPGAWELTRLFIHMWEMLGRTLPNGHGCYRPLEEREAEGWVQSFGDGPVNNPDNPAEDLFLQCITNAHEYIWMTTPYFAVEDSMVQALCMASDSGVDVRLLLPGIPDHRYTYIVYRSHYARLMEHGVKIYEFTPGFLHLKSFIVDGEVAEIGSVNMDYRSFQFHFECGTVLYGPDSIGKLREDLEGVMARSERIDPVQWAKRPWHKRAIEKVLRIFDILM